MRLISLGWTPTKSASVEVKPWSFPKPSEHGRDHVVFSDSQEQTRQWHSGPVGLFADDIVLYVSLHHDLWFALQWSAAVIVKISTAVSENHNSFLDKIRFLKDILWRLEMQEVLCFLIRSVEVIPVLMYCRRPWLPHSRWCFKHADWGRLGGRCLRDYSNRFKVSQRWWSQGVACGDNSGPTHQPFITHHTLGRFLAAHPSGWAEPPTTHSAFSSVAHGLLLLRTAELVFHKTNKQPRRVCCSS